MVMVMRTGNRWIKFRIATEQTSQPNIYKANEHDQSSIRPKHARACTQHVLLAPMGQPSQTLGLLS